MNLEFSTWDIIVINKLPLIDDAGFYRLARECWRLKVFPKRCHARCRWAPGAQDTLNSQAGIWAREEVDQRSHFL